MSLPGQASLADVKNRLSEFVDGVERVHGRVVITKHGRPAAVIMSIEDLESLEATLQILSDPRLMEEIRDSDGEIAKGRSKKLTKEQALALTKRK
jgi:prevent-host-death family protein